MNIINYNYGRCLSCTNEFFFEKEDKSKLLMSSIFSSDRESNTDVRDRVYIKLAGSNMSISNISRTEELTSRPWLLWLDHFHLSQGKF